MGTDDTEKILASCTGFEWDEHNAPKLWSRHKVSITECEQLFLNTPLIVAADVKHSVAERRFYALGQTDEQRLLFAAFTVRQDRVRVISARDMSRKERNVYQQP